MAILKKKHTVAYGTFLGLAALTVSATTDASADTEKEAPKNVTPKTGESALGPETTGHLDVAIDHSNLDSAVSHAESAGIKVIRTETEVLIGDANKTAENIAKTKEYYAKRTAEIEAEITKYKAKTAAYDQEVKKNKEDADNANGQMAALRSNLAAYGQTVTADSKEYDSVEVTETVQKIKDSIEFGKKYQTIKNEVAEFNTQQNSYVSFQTQADQGNIKLQREAVKIATVGEAKQYLEKVKKSYAELQTYITNLRSQTGAIEDAVKPSYTLYDVSIAQEVIDAALKPVEVPTWTAKSATRPTQPIVEYKYFDVRSTPAAKNGVNNADSEVITAKETKEDGTKVYQALKGQTVAVVGENEPLPDGRYDKIHNIITEYVLPQGVEIDEARNLSDEDWKFTYDKDKRLARYEATNKYLLKVNNKQNVRTGTVSGSISGEWYYTTPGVFVKTTEDNKEYRFNSTTMVNDEYMTKSKDTIIQTNAATPEKHNKDNKGVKIDGKTVWFGSTNNYHITWDFDQYRGVNIDKEMQKKGLFIADYAPFDALDMAGNPLVKYNGSTIATGRNDGTFVDTAGKVINGLNWQKVDKIEGINEKGPALKVSITGYDHPFYKEYVEKGKNLEVVLPMSTKVIDNTPKEQGGTYGGNTFKNVAYQSDFGNVYKTNEVINHTPVIDPRKDAVLAVSNLTSMDLRNNPTAAIEKDSYFQYRAKSSIIDVNTIHDFDIKSYSIRDVFHEADQYDGIYYTETNAPIHFKPGTTLYNRYKSTNGVMSANTDITKYTTQKLMRNISADENTAPGVTKDADTRVTKVELEFDEDFLSQIDFTKAKFSVDTFFQAKRVKNVPNVTNVFEELINGKPFGSNETRTNTSKSAVEKINDSVDEFKDTVGKTLKRQDQINNEVLGSLTIIRKEIADNKADQDKKNLEQDDAITKNILSIRKLETRVDKVESDVSKNKDAIDLHSEALSVISRIQDNHEKRITTLEEKVKEEYSYLTIYVKDVTTDSEALDYAVKHGIAPTSIKEITVNDRGNFVLKYNTSEKAINGSKESTIGEDNVEKFKKLHPERLGKYEFYNHTSEDEVRKTLADYGYAGTKVKDITLDGTKYIATVELGESDEAVISPGVDANHVGRAGEKVDVPTTTPETSGKTETPEAGKAGEKVDVPSTTPETKPEAGKAGEKVETPETKPEVKPETGKAGEKVNVPSAPDAKPETGKAGEKVETPETKPETKPEVGKAGEKVETPSASELRLKNAKLIEAIRAILGQ